MKRQLLNYLVCPRCRGPFECQAEEEQDGEIVTGTLSCPCCGASYPIQRSIPRILPQEVSLEKERTARTFGWEWQEFHHLHESMDDYRRQFMDWIYPIEPRFFQGKMVLDAGCGMGRFAAVAAQFGAKEVIAIDISDAVEAARAFTKGMPNVHVVQADIYSLPFGASFDFAFCIGVLHHLPDPEGGFRALVGHVKEGGSLFAWVYGYENNAWIVKVVNPVREKLLSRFHPKALYALSFMITLLLHPVLKLLYRTLNQWPPVKPLARFLPYNGYFSWLSQFGFRHNHHVVFDHMAAPTAYYIRREEFESWFRGADLKDVVLSWRNRNSWRGWGFRSFRP